METAICADRTHDLAYPNGAILTCLDCGGTVMWNADGTQATEAPLCRHGKLLLPGLGTECPWCSREGGR